MFHRETGKIFKESELGALGWGLDRGNTDGRQLPPEGACSWDCTGEGSLESILCEVSRGCFSQGLGKL